ncbi:MAG: 3-oxoacyl-[acyl-carrier-protein] synthase III C-terminal domain-containing protein [Flavobacteriales bacterium]
MAKFSVNAVQIDAIISCLAPNKQDNKNNALLDKPEAFIAHTGIGTTYHANQKDQISAYFLQAAKSGLKSLSWKASDIAVLICVSQTPDVAIPSCANQIHAALQGSDSCLCFDINQGCSGFVYGLSTAAQYLEKIPGGKALLCVGDFSSRLTDPLDPSTRPVFSDAVSVCFLSHNATAAPMHFSLESIAKGHGAIQVKTVGKLQKMDLNGIDVFSYSVQYVPRQINQLIAANTSFQDPHTHLVLHQANSLINKAIVNKLSYNLQVHSSIEKYGNTSSASIPITLSANTEISKKGGQFCLSGFGVGFSIATVLLELEENLVLSILTYEES